MKILLSGSSGLVGRCLTRSFESAGHETVRLVRDPAPAGRGAVRWDPARGVIDRPGLEGIDAAVHLAGESIADGRWNDAKKARIRDSRVAGTRLLGGALAEMERPPKVLACASAIGYYGDRGDEVLREDSPSGTDFLARTCREWEDAAGPAARRGIRVAHLRFGFILSPDGGGLAKMLPPFRAGLGGPLGDGRQWISWVAIDDVAGAVAHVLATSALAGPINVVSPRPVTNRDFTRTLGRVLSRPAVFPMPAFAARLAFGEVADALLLASQRVEPARLVSSGYRFRHPEIEGALRHVLGRAAAA